MAVMGRSVARLVCLGRPDRPVCATPHDGRWLVEYDPARPGGGGGGPVRAHVVTTADRAAARVFDSAQQLYDYLWAAGPGEAPGGGPNRPIFAYTIAAEPWEQT